MADLNFPQNPAPGDTYSIGSRTWVWNGSGWALQSGIVSTNPFIVVSAQVTTTTNSTSTNSGAIIVAGGGGFGGDIWAADIYSNGEQVVTTGTIGSFGVSGIQAGTDTAVANLGGNVVLVWNTSTLETVTSRGNSTTNSISVTNTTASTSTNSGALTVAGGVGIGGSVTVGGGVGVSNNLHVSGGIISLDNATSNALSFAPTGVNAPTFTTKSAGTKVVLYPALGGSATDYAIGIDAGTLWNSLPQVDSGMYFKWYGGTTEVASLSGTGVFSATSVYDNTNRVLTSVTPVAGTAISVSAVSTSGPNTTFTINNTGVTATIGTAYLGVSDSAGAVTFTNLGVHSLSGTTYLGVSQATGTITLTNLGVQTLTAGTGTAVSASTGTVTITSTDTLQSVTDRGDTTNQRIIITNATGASTTTDGALVVTGGVGIGQNLWVAGTANIVGRTTFSDAVVFNGTATFVLSTNTVYTDNILDLHTTATTAPWAFDDGKDIGLRFNYYNRTLATGTSAGLVLASNSQFLEWYGSGAEGDNVFTGSYGTFRTGAIRLTSTEANIATTGSGALQVQGGVGIVGTQYIAGSGGVANSNTVSQQSLIIAAGGVGVYGASHFANAVGLGGNLTVTGTSILSGAVATGDGLTVGSNFTVSGITRLIGAATASSTFGVRGNFNVTGTSLLIGNVYADSDVGVNGNLAVTGTSVLTGITRINDNTNSADTGSGALVVAGGAGFGGNVNVGGNIFVQGVINATVVGSIDTATNITAGTAGAIAVQTAFGRTSFINPGAAGTILTSNGTGAIPSYQNTLTLASAVNAISTLTGALITLGGVGVGKDLWVGGDLYVGGQQALTTASVNQFANQTFIFAGTDTAVTTSTGNITIWNTSTLASVTDRGGITPTALVFTNQTQSTSTDTGALVIGGGLGVNKNVTIGENLTVFGNINFQGQSGTGINGNTATFGTIIATGTNVTGLFVTGNSTIGGNLTATTINVTGRSTLQDTTAATLTATNITVTNNQTVNGTLNVGGDFYTTGTAHLIGAVYAGSNVGIQGNLYTTGTTTLAGSATAESTLGVRGNFNVTGTSLLVGGVHSVGNLGVTGNFNVTGTTTLSAITATVIRVISTATLAGDVNIGPSSQYTSYESTTATTTATISLDSFASTEYRTVKYLVQVADTSVTPNKVHVAEFLVFHDNNGVSTQAYVIQYGIGSNTGELGIWDAVYNAGAITLQFTPNYVPGALTVKTVRTAITV
jgi:hypothetical protein